MPRRGFVYVLASRRNGTLYVGVTSGLARRLGEHQRDAVEGFTNRYGVHRLVYVEAPGSTLDATRRENQIKQWRRLWRVELIEATNPNWLDLSDSLR